ncbi:MAG: hypothetical protein ACM3OH_04545 [Bacillota bacterium]|jgi:hypothetical protein
MNNRPALYLVPAARALAVVVAVTAGAAAGRPVAAQNPAATRIPAAAKYGKWALLAGSIGFNLQALHEHHVADDTFAQLNDLCTAAEHSRCLTDASGVYLDPVAEGIYQSSIRADRRARLWLVAGETVLLGSAAIFVWELSRPKGPNPNIPFTPHVGVIGDRTTLGLAIAF